MTASPTNAAPLDAEHAAFIQRFVSINVATRTAANLPLLSRALGCRVTPDWRVTVFVSERQASALLDGVRATRAIAVVFSQPSTHRTIQLKGTDATVVPLADGDRALMAAYRESFVADLAPAGYAEAFARAMLGAVDDPDIVGIAFTPSAAFAQTPGPGAGRQLQGRP